MEQLVIEQTVAPAKAVTVKLWYTLSSDVCGAFPPVTTFIIINQVICGATIFESHAIFIPQGVAVRKDVLSASTLADLQSCLQRRTNDTFPVRLWSAARPVLESPRMFIESQTSEYLVLKHAWWQNGTNMA